MSFLVDPEGCDSKRNREIAEALHQEFGLTPAGIIQLLDLQTPIYYGTAAYGHFGRRDIDLPWEVITENNQP